MAKDKQIITLATGEQLKGRAAKVYTVLEERPHARNNDWTLMACYILKYYSKLLFTNADGDWCIKLKNLKILCSWQSIRLARQIIQNEHGLLLPTDPKVMRVRKIKEKNIKDAEWREAVSNPMYKN